MALNLTPRVRRSIHNNLRVALEVIIDAEAILTSPRPTPLAFSRFIEMHQEAAGCLLLLDPADSAAAEHLRSMLDWVPQAIGGGVLFSDEQRLVMLSAALLLDHPGVEMLAGLAVSDGDPSDRLSEAVSSAMLAALRGTIGADELLATRQLVSADPKAPVRWALHTATRLDIAASVARHSVPDLEAALDAMGSTLDIIYNEPLIDLPAAALLARAIREGLELPERTDIFIPWKLVRP